MKAVILAGGAGTRLRPLTYTTPKPLIPVANKAVLDRTVERLCKAGIKSAIITTNYLKDQIEKHIREADYPIPVSTVEEKKPLGTAGAVRNVKRKLKGDFLVIQGDTVSDIDISEQIKRHKGIASISLVEVEDPGAYGIVQLSKTGRVKRFMEKPSPGECFSRLANTGTYVLNYGVLDMVPKGRYDFSLDLFPKMLSERKGVYGIVQRGYWKDVGSITNYFSSNRHVLGGMVSGGLGNQVFVSRSARLTPPFLIGENVEVGPEVSIGPNTIIGNNCKLGRGSRINGSILHDSVKLGSGCRVEGCVIGDKSELKDGVFVGSRTVIGSGCIIERNVSISSSSLVGPLIKVQASTEVRGVLSPNIEKIEKVRAILQKIPVFKKLERNELKICMSLVEFGELTEDVLGGLSNIPKDQLDKSLTNLEHIGIVRRNEGMLVMLYEEPERVYNYLKRHL